MERDTFSIGDKVKVEIFEARPEGEIEDIKPERTYPYRVKFYGGQKVAPIAWFGKEEMSKIFASPVTELEERIRWWADFMLY